MTTSGAYEINMTARDFVMAALQDGEIIPLGDEPTDEELKACLLRLNLMLSSMASKAPGVWLNKSEAISVAAAQTTLDAKIANVTDMRASDGRMLGKWTRSEFQSLPNKSAIGSATSFYFDKQRGAGVLNVWPVPVAAENFTVDYTARMEVITNGSDAIDVPQEFYETVLKNLAVKVVGIFGGSLDNLYISEAMQLKQEMEDQARPASYYMRAASA